MLNDKDILICCRNWQCFKTTKNIGQHVCKCWLCPTTQFCILCILYRISWIPCGLWPGMAQQCARQKGSRPVRLGGQAGQPALLMSSSGSLHWIRLSRRLLCWNLCLKAVNVFHAIFLTSNGLFMVLDRPKGVFWARNHINRDVFDFSNFQDSWSSKERIFK